MFTTWKTIKFPIYESIGAYDYITMPKTELFSHIESYIILFRLIILVKVLSKIFLFYFFYQKKNRKVLSDF